MRTEGPFSTTNTRLLCCIFCCCVQYYFLFGESLTSTVTLKNRFSTAAAVKTLLPVKLKRSLCRQSPSTKLLAEREWSESEIEKFPYAAASVTSTTEVIPTSRFVVQNRFQVRKGREAAFEKRWAERKSRLGILPGFRFFCILRKVDDDDSDDDNNGSGDGDDPNNYVSCTVWEKYENFETWKKGDAFKEAHGGGTVKGVMSMLAATARNTKGKPKPAYWKGLLPETRSTVGYGNPHSSSDGEGSSESEGWRQIETDGSTILPRECFAAMNRFSVAPTMETVFERKFADRESTLKDCEGFRGFLLLRRDGKKQPGDGGDPDDGYTHSTFSIWDEKANFDAWMASNKNNKTSNRKPTNGNGNGNGNDTADANPDATQKGGPPKIYTRPPVPTFYEGILVLENKAGM